MKLNFYEKLLREAPGEPSGGNPADTPPAPDATPAGPDLSFIPADFHVDGKPYLTKFSASYQELVARDAQRAEAEAALKSQVPEGDYAFTLPEDLKFDGIELPPDFKVDLLTEDETMKPLFGELSSWMKGKNLPAAASTELMSLLAKYQAVQVSKAHAAMKSDLATLGTPAQVEARIANVGRIVQGRLPKDQAEAVMSMTASAAAFRALETLLGPTGTTPPPAPPPPKYDLAEYYSKPTR